MVNLVNAYCLVHPEVRITCAHQSGTNAKTTVVRTPGGCSLRENIVTLFGAKQMQQLLPFVQSTPETHASTKTKVAAQCTRIMIFLARLLTHSVTTRCRV